MTTTTAEELDERSPLRGCRDRFDVPEGVIYLNGNSLGALPRGVPGRLQDVITREWGDGLIRSWNDADWIGLHRRVGDRIAPLVGAAAGDVHVGDSTSVSLFKTMVVALRLRPDRRVIVVEPTTFPTDGYVAQGVARLTGAELRWCDPADPLAAVDDDVALLSLTHVDFRTGAMYDLPGITAAAHERGALMQWDLCHSAGAVPVDLTGADADIAVGCTYKYLNGGPGSPAFTWIAPRLQADVDQPITGWMGHARPFAMERDYVPLPGIARMASGTHSVLALSALDAALERVRRREHGRPARHVASLTDLFVSLVSSRFGDALPIVTPARPRPPGQPGLAPAPAGLRAGAGADRTGSDRRLPGARHRAVRVRAALRHARRRPRRGRAPRGRAGPGRAPRPVVRGAQRGHLTPAPCGPPGL